MERQNPGQLIDEKIMKDMETARKNGIHIDVAVNPFISEVDRPPILQGKAQDPEWD